MRVKLLNDGGYEGLVNVQFPVEVEVEREGYGNVYVGWDAISAIPGWFHHKNDAYEGGSYCFYRYEVEIVVNPKIRVHSPSGYSGLMGLDFPIMLEAHRIEEDKTAFVKASILRALGVETGDGDFVFLEEEYTLIEEKKCLENATEELTEVLRNPLTPDEAFGANPSPESLEANKHAADISMKDILHVSSTFVQNVADAARKDKLISLVRDYGGAISDGCYESERGSLQVMFACHEEEKRLLKEIIKMIEEGV